MIVAIATQKGGSGKTTTAVNLSAALAALGERTLLVDLDGQGHASYWLLGPTARSSGAFVQDWLEQAVRAEQVVRATERSGLDLLPANLELNRLRDRLQPVQRPADGRLLRDRLSRLRRAYPWIVLDCPAGLNPLTINALIAADWLLVPVSPPDSLAVDGLQHMLATLERVRGSANSKLQLLGVLLANAQLHRATQRRQAERLRSERLPIFETIVPLSARVGAAAEAHQSLLAYAPASPAAAAFRALAEEVARAQPGR